MIVNTSVISELTSYAVRSAMGRAKGRIGRSQPTSFRRSPTRLPGTTRTVQSQISSWINLARPGITQQLQQRQPVGRAQARAAAVPVPAQQERQVVPPPDLHPPHQNQAVIAQENMEEAAEPEPEEERLALHDRSRPLVPPARNLDTDTGWSAIWRLGGWNAFLVQCPMLEEVPEQHKGAWCTAWNESLSKWKEATSDEEADTALLWMGFWAQGLQRKPSRGGRQGRVEVASRYECVVQGDWAGLVERWERDKLKREQKYSAREGRRPNRDAAETEQKDLAKQRRIVLGLIESGQLGKAMGRVNSHGLGDINNPVIRDQLTEKFPPRQRPLPDSVPKIKPIDNFKDIRTSLLSLNPGTAPGSGGLRNEYLTAWGERMEDRELKLLEDLGLAYSAGELPAWYYVVWQSLQTVAPFKDNLLEAVRPLGLKNSLTKLYNKEVMVQSKPEMREFLEPVQLGLSVAGAALLTRSVSGVMQTYKEFICFRLDLKNAFDEMCR